MGRRHTNRRLKERRPLPAGALDAMQAEAASIGARLDWITAEQPLDEVGEVLGAGDRIRFLNQELHRHMMSELRFTPEEAAHTGDGISLGSLELSPGDVAGVQIARSWEALALVKSLDGGNNLKRMSRKAIRASSAVGLLSMPDVDAASFLKGGRAVQRVWLMATRLGIAFHPMTALPYLLARLTMGGGRDLDAFAVAELSHLLPRYRALFPAPGAHVMLFRLAMADAASERALRRPLHECFVER